MDTESILSSKDKISSTIFSALLWGIASSYVQEKIVTLIMKIVEKFLRRVAKKGEEDRKISPRT